MMTTVEPWAIGGTSPNIEPHLATVAMLNANIETITTFKDIIEVAPVKAVFESIIVILTLVKVRFLLFSLLHPLISDTIRAT